MMTHNYAQERADAHIEVEAKSRNGLNLLCEVGQTSFMYYSDPSIT